MLKTDTNQARGQTASDLSPWHPHNLLFPIMHFMSHQLPSRVGCPGLKTPKWVFSSAHPPAHRYGMQDVGPPSSSHRLLSEKPPWSAPSCSSTMGTSNIIDPARQADRRWGAARGWRLGVQLRTNPSSPSLKGLCPEAGRGVWGERELCAACAHSVPQPHRGQG